MSVYADLGRTYRNPILFADYSDPDVIRVGDTFYMTASSFNYTPGLPILISKDLVNWKLVNYALKNIGQERFRIPRHSEGVWAPAIRYHEGMFYIYYGMPDEGYYVVRTKDPLGEWEKPVCILEGKGLIDSCPFWDEDGKAYVIHGYAKSRIGFKSILGIFEMTYDGLKAVSEDHFIFNGNDPTHPAVTIEGPKVYKRNGYYYIWAPAGGVKEGYQVVLRSKDIHGPYEIKTVMDSGNTVINGPHQGGLVNTVNGDEWFVHFQDRGLYGRICHLQPVSWNEDWPVVGFAKETDPEVGEPVYEYRKPDCEIKASSETESYFPCFGESTIYKLEDDSILDRGFEPAPSDSFPGGRIGLQWQWLGDHEDSFCGEVTPDKITSAQYAGAGSKVNHGLRLFCQNPSKDKDPIIWRSANVLTQKLVYPVFEAVLQMDVTGLGDKDRAGVVMAGGQYLTVYIEKDMDEYYICVAESEGGDADKREVVKSRKPLREVASDFAGRLVFRMTFTYRDKEFDSGLLYFQNVNRPMFGENPCLSVEIGVPGIVSKDHDEERLSESNKEGEPCDIKYHDLDVNYTPSDHTWVGAKLGIYAISGQTDSEGGFADVYSFDVNEL